MVEVGVAHASSSSVAGGGRHVGAVGVEGGGGGQLLVLLEVLVEAGRGGEQEEAVGAGDRDPGTECSLCLFSKCHFLKMNSPVLRVVSRVHPGGSRSFRLWRRHDCVDVVGGSVAARGDLQFDT